jgi:hypothetical protein
VIQKLRTLMELRVEEVVNELEDWAHNAQGSNTTKERKYNIKGSKGAIHYGHG